MADRKEYHVLIYDKDRQLIGDGIVMARNPFQAAADAMLKVDARFEIDRVLVDKELIVREGLFKDHIAGKGFYRTGTSNIWFRVPVQIVRTVRRLLPDRSKGWFVSDAIEEKIKRERAELEAGTSEYQKQREEE